MTRPQRAMVLAAGRGERMRPIAAAIPKPLVTVCGRTLLDRALDHLVAAGIADVVVNTHHLAAQVAGHVANRTAPRIAVSHEDILLDTGGGVAKALPRLGTAPFYVVNSDALWVDGAAPALERLAAAWADGAMDALLLLVPVAGAYGYDGQGDYEQRESGALTARRGETAPYVFGGVQLLHPRLFADVAVEAFSLKRLYDRAEAAGRLFGLVHDGAWYHVGTPDALAEAERRLAGHR